MSRVIRLSVIAIAVSVGIYFGCMMTQGQGDVGNGNCDFCQSVLAAQKNVDCRFGRGTFLKGLKRVLKNEKYRRYCFWVDVVNTSKDKKEELLIISVNLANRHNVVRIEPHKGN